MLETEKIDAEAPAGAAGAEADAKLNSDKAQLDGTALLSIWFTCFIHRPLPSSNSTSDHLSQMPPPLEGEPAPARGGGEKEGPPGP